jgi:hypothetical protein
MACGKSTTPDDAGHQGGDIVISRRRLDEILTLAIERTCDALLPIAIEHCTRCGSEGHDGGYKRGHAHAYRKEKGGEKSSKIPAEDVVAITVGELGAWPDIKLFMATAREISRSVAAGTVLLHQSKDGVLEDVIRFLRAPKSRRPDDWPEVPEETTLRREYYRQRPKALKTTRLAERKEKCTAARPPRP